MPDPDDGMEYPQRRYQIYLKSQSGPVEVFLVSQTEQQGDAAVHTPPAGQSAAAAKAQSDGAGSSTKRNSSKRSRADAAAEDGAGGGAEDGADGGAGLLKLNPLDESAADYWSAAPPTSHDLGVADLFFNDTGEVKVEG